MDALNQVRDLFSAIEEADLERLEALYSDDAVQIEYPNRLLPNGATRDKRQILEAAARGRAVMAEQTLTITQSLVQDSRVAVEARWTGRLAVNVSPLGLTAGAVMTAHFAQFIEFSGGRVKRHVTYDCFEPWGGS